MSDGCDVLHQALNIPQCSYLQSASETAPTCSSSTPGQTVFTILLLEAAPSGVDQALSEQQSVGEIVTVLPDDDNDVDEASLTQNGCPVPQAQPQELQELQQQWEQQQGQQQQMQLVGESDGVRFEASKMFRTFRGVGDVVNQRGCRGSYLVMKVHLPTSCQQGRRWQLELFTLPIEEDRSKLPFGAAPILLFLAGETLLM